MKGLIPIDLCDDVFTKLLPFGSEGDSNSESWEGI